MIGTAEIEAMRRTIEEAALPETGEIQRFTSVADGMGGETRTPTTVIPSVACRVALPAGTPGMALLGKALAERIANRLFYVASFPAETDVRDDDLLIVAGVTYQVLAGKINGSWELARRAMVIRVE